MRPGSVRQAIARLYVKRRLKRDFFDVRLIDRTEVTAPLLRGPVIFAINHVCWWDPMVLVQLAAHLSIHGYCLMDATNLKDLPFFRWVGAIPIDRTSKFSAYRDLARSVENVNGPGQALAIFPHGDQRPAHLPLEFRRGVALLAKKSGFPVVPLAFRYDFTHGPLATVHIAATPALQREAGESDGHFIHRIERGVEFGLTRVDDVILNEHRAESILGRHLRSERVHRLPVGARALRLVSPPGEDS